MSPDDIMGIFEGTVRQHQGDASLAALGAYIDWLSRNWRDLDADDLSALLRVGAAAYAFQTSSQASVCPPYVEASLASPRGRPHRIDAVDVVRTLPA